MNIRSLRVDLLITHAGITRFVGHKYESVTAKLGENTRRVNALVAEFRDLCPLP